MSLIDTNLQIRPVDIEITPGRIAPRYGDECGALASVLRAVITERGTAGDLPIVDLIGEVNGKQVVLVISGRLLDSIASAVRGVNLRNHGVERP